LIGVVPLVKYLANQVTSVGLKKFFFLFIVAVWDIEIAFEFPNAKIIGIDYESATVSSLTDTVINFSFQSAMMHQGKSGLETIEDNTVDYIMMRDVMLVNSPAQKWINIFKEIYRILKPGGYIEIYENGK
jgi:ubiquinone/menaquinone biosynthesis C-methylase UbiE